MVVRHLGHAGVTVGNLERSLAFYGGLLRFEARARRVIDEPWLAQLLGLPEAVVDAIDLAVPGTGEIVQLFEFVVPRDAATRPGMTVPGSVHLAFTVEDLDRLLARLAAAGVPLVGSPVTITSGENTGGSLACVRDPDGIVIEFFEAPRRSAS